MTIDPAQTIAAALASAVGTLLAGAIGYRYAMAKFRRERTFDRQLEWYDRATKAFYDVAAKINWAMASEVAGLAPEEKRRLWTEVHGAMSGLRALEAEAEMYATPEGYETLSEALRDIGAMSSAMLTLPNWAQPSTERRIAMLYELCQKLLRHAASRLSDDVRQHLGLPLIEREWGLYDRETRALRRELEEWKARGVDFSDGAWADPDLAARTEPRTST